MYTCIMYSASMMVRKLCVEVLQTSLGKFGFAKVRLRQCAGSIVYISLFACGDLVDNMKEIKKKQETATQST